MIWEEELLWRYCYCDIFETTDTEHQPKLEKGRERERERAGKREKEKDTIENNIK